MMKTALATLLLIGTVGAASAQTVYGQQRQYDYGATGTIQRYENPNFTGTMGDKWRGPGKTTGNSWGPDGTPGNGSPGKQNGQR